jgi:hypothetical protein
MRKPSGYWTKEKCHELALECESKKEFEKKHPKAYGASRKSKGNWMDEICEHMKEKNHVWTKEECHALALECNTRSDFQKKYTPAYAASKYHVWLDEVCEHMIETSHKWTKEECHALALQCDSRKDFVKKHKNAYNASSKNGWLDEIRTHMNEINHYWSKEECHALALECKSRIEFSIKHPNAYCASRTRAGNWMDEICSHMKYQGNRYIRGVYSYKIFFGGIWYAYSGLAYNFDGRHQRHLYTIKKGKSTCTVDNFCIKNNIELPMYEIAYDYTDVETARLLEEKNLSELKEQGFITLNRSKCGGVGGDTIKWTKEICHALALDCETRNEFKHRFNGAYNASLKSRGDWIDDISSHMKEKNNKWTKEEYHKWTKEECHALALECKSRTEFFVKNPRAYASSRKRKGNWMDEICSHMIELKKPNGYWTKEKCHELALECKSKNEFRKKYPSAYDSSITKKLLNEICLHMIETSHKWIKDECAELALECNTKIEFLKKHKNAYFASSKQRGNWLDEICSHMFINKNNKQ